MLKPIIKNKYKFSPIKGVPYLKVTLQKHKRNIIVYNFNKIELEESSVT